MKIEAKNWEKDLSRWNNTLKDAIEMSKSIWLMTGQFQTLLSIYVIEFSTNKMRE